MDRPCLAEALQSVLMQDYPRIELLVVSAAGDAHQALPQSTENVSVRLVGDMRPLRRSAAANLGLAETAGDYRMFLDDDDRILPKHVSKLVSALESHPAAPLAYSGVRCVDQGWEPVGREYRQPFSRLRLFAGNYIPIHAALFRSELVCSGQCRFDESLDLYEDWDFWLQVMQHGDFIYCDGISAEYRVGGCGQGFGVNFSAEAYELARLIALRWLPAWRDQDRVDALTMLTENDGLRIQCESAMRQLEDADRQLHAADASMRSLAERLRECEVRNQELPQDIMRLEQELARRNAELMQIQGSTSWRLTAPLRRVGSLIKRRG